MKKMSISEFGHSMLNCLTLPLNELKEYPQHTKILPLIKANKMFLVSPV